MALALGVGGGGGGGRGQLLARTHKILNMVFIFEFINKIFEMHIKFS